MVAGVAGLALIAELKSDSMGQIKAEQVLVKNLAGEPGKEVNIQVYTFPPGARYPGTFTPIPTNSAISSTASSRS